MISKTDTEKSSLKTALRFLEIFRYATLLGCLISFGTYFYFWSENRLGGNYTLSDLLFPVLTFQFLFMWAEAYRADIKTPKQIKSDINPTTDGVPISESHFSVSPDGFKRQISSLCALLIIAFCQVAVFLIGL